VTVRQHHHFQEAAKKIHDLKQCPLVKKKPDIGMRMILICGDEGHLLAVMATDVILHHLVI